MDKESQMEPASPTEAPLTRPRLTRQASFKDTCRFNISYGTPHWGWNELRRPSLFRNAYTEFIGTWAFCFLHIGLVLALVKQSVTPSGETLYSTSVAVALATFVSFTLLVYSMALPSGGHFNPMFSMSQAFTGLISISKGLVYVAAQTLGGIMGATCVWGLLDDNDPIAVATHYAGCSWNGLDAGRAFLAEFLFCFIVLFVAHAVAFIPSQFNVFGPVISPMALAAILGANIVAASLVAPGVGMNPARCLGSAIVNGGEDHHWIHWIAPLTASIVHGITHFLSPPYHRETADDRDLNKKAAIAGKRRELQAIDQV